MMNEAGNCTCVEEVDEHELLTRLDEVLLDYRDKPGALIPVLQIAQSIFGYLPQSALKRISVGLNKSYSEVAGVVGFYSFFSTVPRGKHVIRVCLGTACYVRGGKRVLDAFKRKLGIDVRGLQARSSDAAGRYYCALPPRGIWHERRERCLESSTRILAERYVI